MADLETLYMWDNGIATVTALEGLANLETVEMSNNGIVDLAPLLGNPGLGNRRHGGCQPQSAERRVHTRPHAGPGRTRGDVSHRHPDPALRAAVHAQLGKPGAITSANMARLVLVNASAQRIRSLRGLEFATDARGLGFSNNEIADLTPLAALTDLQILYLTDNRISDLSRWRR